MRVTSGRAEKPYMHEQSKTNCRGNLEAILMFNNKITYYTIDTIAFISALFLAAPFALVISAPFLGGL